MNFVAICSEEYLGYYNVLYQSVKRFYPNVKQTLYYIGANIPVSGGNGFDEVIDITHWHTNPDYNKLEAICSLRARVVLDAFGRNYTKVVFLGAKMQFFAYTDEIEAALDNYNAFVTPHILEPLPEDGCFPCNASVSWTGHISTDMVAFRNTPEIVKFLQWQDEIMKTKVKTTNYTYLDQNWLNFLPFFVDNIFISRNPAYNVAYWNYKQRNLQYIRGINSKWMVDEVPMVCFQFSGLDLDKPEAISHHQNRYKADGDFLNFLTTYCNRVKEYK